MTGSVKASSRRGRAIKVPTTAGFMPSPKFKTMDIMPMAAAKRLLTKAPMP